MPKVLLLGGTSEASALARALAGSPDVEATLSLAGRTREPSVQPIPTRIGGFGGADGLAGYLEREGIGALVDATHPFAAQMSANAVAAAAAVGIPLLRVERPPWVPVDGDRWIEVASIQEAGAALGESPRRVFLTVGRLDLAPFAARPEHHYLVRAIDLPDPALLPGAKWLAGRGPFTFDDEIALLRGAGIDILVTKNSGAAATSAKLTAARALGLPVVMVRRPQLPPTETVATVDAALDWIRRRVHRPVALPRGV